MRSRLTRCKRIKKDKVKTYARVYIFIDWFRKHITTELCKLLRATMIMTGQNYTSVRHVVVNHTAVETLIIEASIKPISAVFDHLFCDIKLSLGLSSLMEIQL